MFLRPQEAVLVCGLPLSSLPALGFPTHQLLQQVGLGMASCVLSQAPGSSSGVPSNRINLGLTLNLEPGGLGSNPRSAANQWDNLRQVILPPCAEASSAVKWKHRASCPHLLINKTRLVMTVNKRVHLNPLFAVWCRQTLRTCPQMAQAPSCAVLPWSRVWRLAGVGFGHRRAASWQRTTGRRGRRWEGRTREEGAWPHHPRRWPEQCRALRWRLC